MLLRPGKLFSGFLRKFSRCVAGFGVFYVVLQVLNAPHSISNPVSLSVAAWKKTWASWRVFLFICPEYFPAMPMDCYRLVNCEWADHNTAQSRHSNVQELPNVGVKTVRMRDEHWASKVGPGPIRFFFNGMPSPKSGLVLSTIRANSFVEVRPNQARLNKSNFIT